MMFLGEFAKLVSSSGIAFASAPGLLVNPAVAWGVIMGAVALSCAALWLLNSQTERPEPRPDEASQPVRWAA